MTALAGPPVDALAAFQYADAARYLYEFSWDEFCSFYVEMTKGRLQDPAARPMAQRVLAHTLDTLLRLLHPMQDPVMTAARERSTDPPGCSRPRGSAWSRFQR